MWHNPGSSKNCSSHAPFLATFWWQMVGKAQTRYMSVNTTQTPFQNEWFHIHLTHSLPSWAIASFVAISIIKYENKNPYSKNTNRHQYKSPSSCEQVILVYKRHYFSKEVQVLKLLSSTHLMKNCSSEILLTPHSHSLYDNWHSCAHSSTLLWNWQPMPESGSL